MGLKGGGTKRGGSGLWMSSWMPVSGVWPPGRRESGIKSIE
jgi:hypothetical protein